MRQKIIVIIVFLILISCKDSALKKSDTKIVNEQKGITIEEIEHESDSINQDSVEVWKGKYYFESQNRDDMITSFEVHIKEINNISVKYISDGEKPELYKNIVGEIISPNKLKINFNTKYDEMGVILLEKDGNEFTISGEPIYFINPGSDNLTIKKMN